MIEHLTQKQCEDFCRRQLVKDELIPVSEHLNSCETCRRQVEAVMNSDATFLVLSDQLFDERLEFSHLTAEQVGLYVDKRLIGEDLQTATDHLSVCERCALAVTDLQAFSKEVAPSLHVQYGPADVGNGSDAWLTRTFTSLSEMFRLRPAPAFGAALVILLLAVVAWFIWRNNRSQEPAPQIAVTTSTPQPSPSSQPVRSPPPVQPESAPVVAQLRDGNGELTLDKDGELSGANGLPAAYQNLIKRALTSRKVERSPQLEGLSRPPSSMMGANDREKEFSIVGPAGVVSLTDRPTFSWKALPGATGYIVEVYDSDFKQVLSSEPLAKTSWSPPQALSRGRVYSWQVKALKNGEEITSPRPPAPQAKFRVLDQARMSEISKAKRGYGSSHLVLGMLYADAGLLREAEQEFRLLLKANPDSEIARSLFRQVQSLENQNR